MTSDSNNPVWRLPSKRDAELRDELNQAAIALRDFKGIREVNMGRAKSARKPCLRNCDSRGDGCRARD